MTGSGATRLRLQKSRRAAGGAGGRSWPRSGSRARSSVTLGLPLAIAGELVRCWAVGYSGVTTRGDEVSAPELVTAGPYAYVRNPLYVGNFITAAGFAIAFTGRNSSRRGLALIAGSLAAMAGVYATIVPHEENVSCDRSSAKHSNAIAATFRRWFRGSTRLPGGKGTWRPEVIKDGRKPNVRDVRRDARGARVEGFQGVSP